VEHAAAGGGGVQHERGDEALLSVPVAQALAQGRAERMAAERALHRDAGAVLAALGAVGGDRRRAADADHRNASRREGSSPLVRMPSEAVSNLRGGRLPRDLADRAGERGGRVPVDRLEHGARRAGSGMEPVQRQGARARELVDQHARRAVHLRRDQS
jgi:hypothetical protein